MPQLEGAQGLCPSGRQRQHSQDARGWTRCWAAAHRGSHAQRHESPSRTSRGARQLPWRRAHTCSSKTRRRRTCWQDRSADRRGAAAAAAERVAARRRVRGSGRERLTCEAVSVYVSVTDHEFWPVSDTASLMQNTLTVTVWPAAPTCVTAVTTAKFAANVHFHRISAGDDFSACRASQQLCQPVSKRSSKPASRNLRYWCMLDHHKRGSTSVFTPPSP